MSWKRKVEATAKESEEKKKETIKYWNQSIRSILGKEEKGESERR